TRGDHDRKREAPTLTARERDDRLLVLVPAGEEEPAEERLRLRALEPGAPHRRVEHRPALVELCLVLREVRGDDAVSETRRAAGRVPLPEQRLEQRRLAGAVRADERDMLAPLDRERRAVEQELLARLHAQPIGD